MKTLDTVSLFIRQKNLISPGDRIVCGLSGGADSCTMVNILHMLSNELKFSVVCAHLHHGLRGKEADRDLAFAKSFSESLNIPFFSKKTDISAIAKEKGISPEDAGRQERYNFFCEVMEETGANKIATAHNKDDNAETILMHIVRSSGIKGICGIPPMRGNIIRPLLCVTRSEIENYCKKTGLEYVTDSTNSLADYTRNKFRLEIIPALENINPSVKDALCRLGEAATLQQSFIESQAEKVNLNLTEMGAELSVEELKTLHPSIIPEVLRRVLEKLSTGFYISENSVTSFTSLISTGKTTGKVELGSGFTARLSYGKIFVSSGEIFPYFEHKLTKEEPIYIYGKKIYIGTTVPQNCTAIPWDGKSEITLRSRRPGDKMKIRGMSRKLQDMFVNLKIDRVLRDKLLLIALGSTVVWAEKIGYDDSMINTNAENYIIITSEEHL